MRSAIASCLLAAALAIGLSCHEKVSKMNGDKPAVSADRQIENLRKRITFPATPVDVWFEELPRGKQGGIGPTDFVLIAAMRFARDDLDRVIGGAQPRPGSPPRLSKLALQPWLPEPVRSALQSYDDSSVTVRGTKFDASAFAKAPFSSGTFVAIEGGEYIILVLETM